MLGSSIRGAFGVFHPEPSFSCVLTAPCRSKVSQIGPIFCCPHGSFFNPFHHARVFGKKYEEVQTKVLEKLELEFVQLLYSDVLCTWETDIPHEHAQHIDLVPKEIIFGDPASGHLHPNQFSMRVSQVQKGY